MREVESTGETYFDINAPVTVLLPCYNRAADLRVSLTDITGQSYKNLKIIISNNCSTDPEVEKVLLEYAAHDSRIEYYCQEKNLGSVGNNKFLLEKITTDLFFLGSDDDRWHPEFIEVCLKNMKVGTDYSVMPACLMENREQQWVRTFPWFPVLTPRKSKLYNIYQYCFNSVDVLFYGVQHKRAFEYYLEFSENELYPLSGYNMLLQMIIETGFKTLPEEMFVWRCDVKKSNVRYGPPHYSYKFGAFYKQGVDLLLRTEKLNNIEKIVGVFLFLSGFSKRFLMFEMQQGDSWQAKMIRYSLYLLKKPLHYLFIRRWKKRNEKIVRFVS